MKSYRFILVIILWMFPCFLHAGRHPDGGIPEYYLHISFDIPHSKISGSAKIKVHPNRHVTMHTGTLAILDLKLNGQPIEFDEKTGMAKIVAPDGGLIEVEYEGFFKGSQSPRDRDGGIAQGIINEKGIFLTGVWYPHIDGLCHYHLTASLPNGYEAISEAEDIRRTTRDGRVDFSFHFPYPADDIQFVASKSYSVLKENFNDIEIHAYFFREDSRLARTYVEYTKKYLHLYESLIGKYPYGRFSIVENLLPTGYSMPTFTLLGRDVVRLPFIVKTSLGHEILHQWFGNHVYVDYEGGNWAEGLTTYLSDHLYKEQQGKGWEYRKGILIDYESYVNDRNEFPLKEFSGRVDYASRAIGYGKAAMVFHMFRTIAGDSLFYESLKAFVNRNRFRRASWEDIRWAFEKHSGRNLGWFFGQWIDETGLPQLHVAEVKVGKDREKWEVILIINQAKRVYELTVPVTFYTQDGKTKELFTIDRERNTARVLLDHRPEKMVLDEDYDIPRRLSKGELPPVVGRLIGDERHVVIRPPAAEGVYKAVIDFFKEKGAVVKRAAEVDEGDMKSSSLVILGRDNALLDMLYGKISMAEGGFWAMVKENPRNPRKVAGIIHGESKEEVDAAFGKIRHYGKYSILSFNNGRNILKEITERSRGVVVRLGE
jgi:aminopeptidase N